MKESVTKFDFEAAFKALDEIDVPSSGNGIKANRPALTEIFSRKSKFDALFEEYYDMGSTEELGEAQEAREAEVAKAKLARIEKIVDLDAESPEDLLTSYVGKYIIQCPQCMTLFYKDKEDVVESEDDAETVNVNEVCQHCGNESGYTLIGKVGEAEADEADSSDLEELPEETPAEEGDETSDESATDTEEDTAIEDGELEDFDLDALNLDEDEVADEEEDKKEESFTAHEGETLAEEFKDDAELDAKLEAHNEYIEYLRTTIAQEEEALEKATNEQVKAAIQRRLDAYKEDLDAALPDAVKVEEPVEEPAEDFDAEADTEATTDNEEVSEPDVQEEALETSENTTLTEALKEDTELDVSAEEFEELINSPEFKKPISDGAARAMVNTEKEPEEKVEESKKSIYGCSNCGYEIEMDDKEYDGCCPNCHEHHGEFMKLEEGIFDWVKGLFTKKLKTRQDIAQFILNNSMVDYEKATVDKKGNVSTDASNKKFTKFIVIGYKGTNKAGKPIAAAPKYDDKNLVVGMKYPEAKDTYTEAENIAKGWSLREGNGPAFIYLAKTDKGDGAAFLCQFFKGELDKTSDQLDKYKQLVLNNLESCKLMSKGGADQSDVKKLNASDVKPGMKVQLEGGKTAEVTKAEASTINSAMRKIEIKLESGDIETINVAADFAFDVLRTSITTEGLETFMADLEELNEAALESKIEKSLTEACGNVESFKITECSYLDEKLTINGEIGFKTGATEKTSYVFTEGFVTDAGTISIHGKNERFGNTKFTIGGYVDKENKTFITESFK